MSNFLHFFNIEECTRIVHQIKERTITGSLIYVGVHSDKYYANNPNDPNNNDYFKQEDMDILFESESFDKIYSADIQRTSSKLDNLVTNNWLEKYFTSLGITDKKKITMMKEGYLNGKGEADLICIYQRK